MKGIRVLFLEFRASFTLIMDVIKEQTVNLEKVLFAVESVAVQDGTNKNKNRDEKCLKYKHCYFKEILPK